MKFFLGVGKSVALLFWLAVLANLFEPFARPFSTLLNGLALLVLGLHVLEALLYNAQLQARPHPWKDRLHLMLFGVFHLASLPKQEANHA